MRTIWQTLVSKQQPDFLSPGTVLRTCWCGDCLINEERGENGSLVYKVYKVGSLEHPLPVAFKADTMLRAIGWCAEQKL